MGYKFILHKDLRLEGVSPHGGSVTKLLEQPRSIEDDHCLLLTPPPTNNLKLKVCKNRECRRRGHSLEYVIFMKMFQVAYDEDYFNYNKRNKTQAIGHLKAAFVHAQIAFCDPSLGTKVHIDVQNANNPIFLEGESHSISFANKGWGKKFASLQKK